jgi:hypothetical protein
VIVPRAGEGFLKVVAAAAWLALAAPAAADELLTGALRDQDGAAVAGARITAFDRAGTVVGHDRSAPDGTFALTTPQRPATLAIDADDSEPLRLAVPSSGPVVAIVTHRRAADRTPSQADVAALPAGRFVSVAELVPYEVAGYGAISDRWLALGHGVTTIEGLPFYRRIDGADASDILPDRALGAVDVVDPLQAPWYGDRAGGGVVNAELFNRADSARAGSDGYTLEAGGNAQVFTATSWDPDGERQLIAARAVTAGGPVSASFLALVGDLSDEYYRGAGVTLRGATRALNLDAQFSVTTDVDTSAATPDIGDVTSIVLDGVGNGPDAIAVRLRWRDERGAYGDATSDHTDAALVAGTTRGSDGAPQLSATLALAFGRELDSGAGAQSSAAVTPAVSYVVPIAPDWSLRAGYGQSTLGTPGIALARASLGEAGLSFSDHRRLNLDLVAYAEGDAAPAAFDRGVGVSLGWEVAPRVSLRAWALGDGEAENTLAPQYSGGPPYPGEVQRTFRRDVVWATWDAPVRLDVLVRNGALEGSLNAPLGGGYGVFVGSARNVRNIRVLSAGLTRTR